MSLSIRQFVDGLIVELVARCKRHNIRFTILAATLSHFNSDIVHPTTCHHFAKCTKLQLLLCPVLHFYSVEIKGTKTNTQIMCYTSKNQQLTINPLMGTLQLR